MTGLRARGGEAIRRTASGRPGTRHDGFHTAPTDARRVGRRSGAGFGDAGRRGCRNRSTGSGGVARQARGRSGG